MVGLLYGALLWTGAALPALAILGVRLRQPVGLLALLALEFLAATLAVGLFCAYAWQRAA